MRMEIKNDSEELYRLYLDGTPVSEISKMTGIKPKAIYKRFERFRNSENMDNTVDSVDKDGDNAVDNVECTDYDVKKTVYNVEYSVDNVDKDSKRLDSVKCAPAIAGMLALGSLGKGVWILLGAVILGLLLYWLYRRWKKKANDATCQPSLEDGDS